MPATFATVWLSRSALVAMVIFGYCAWMAYILDRESKTNRIAVMFNVVFALWAGAASFWYGTGDPDSAMSLYRAFSWTWSVFPPLILHFTLRATGNPILLGRWHSAFLVALYAPCVALFYLVPVSVLTTPQFRGGYWMLSIRGNAPYFFFVGHYFILILVSIIVAFVASARAADRRSGKRYRLLGWSYAVAGVMGFITDTVFLYIGLDVPNMAIFWILILSVGMIVAMSRYGFLSKLPPGAALAVLESMTRIVIFLDDSGRVVWLNPSAVAALGAPSLAHAKKTKASDFLPPALAALIVEPSGRQYDSGGYRIDLGPESIPVNLWIRPVMESGSAGTVLTAIDLRPEFNKARTERRLSDAGLLLDEFVARSLDGIVLTDAAGCVVRWNYPMVAMTGIEAEEALGTPYWELRASVEAQGSVDLERIRKGILAILAGQEPPWMRRILETEILRRGGSRRIIQSDSFSIPLAEGTILAVIARDVTEDHRLAEENIERIRKLDHAQKMEAVGTLSGGIAHDFNNTLAGIIGAASLIRLGIETGSVQTPGDISRELTMIERSAQRAASSVKRLLTLTRKRSPESVVFRLDEALRRVMEFAERSVDQSVVIEARSPWPVAEVTGDAGQVEQLVLNLLINAEHAMTIMRPEGQRRGGTVRVGLSAFHPDKPFIAANVNVVDTDYWAISIRDEGVGIPRHIQNRIFDPFYTTKPDDASSGLGLAMVHAIARQHGGFVDLRSEPGAGAEFIVCIPVASGTAKSSREERQARRGTGLVLVADDDDIPRETAVAVLEALGYRTAAATGGEEAIRVFAERPDDWKAAVLDMRMGDLDGDAVAVRLRAIRADIPVVLASGMHGEDADGSYGLEKSFAILHKPYTISELARALDAALGLE